MNEVTKVQAARVLSLANVNENGQSSLSAFEDADRQYVAGNYEACARWALRSLAHSVGIFHPAYEVAAGITPTCDPFRAVK